MERNWSFDECRMRTKATFELKNIMDGLLEPEQNKRITMNHLIKHKWLIANYNRAQLLANKMKIR